MRKALIVGINYYAQIRELYGCVNDANDVKAVLERHGDGRPNFDARLMKAETAAEPISRDSLKDAVRALFADDCDVALLYFAGHGYAEATGGYLCTANAGGETTVWPWAR